MSFLLLSCFAIRRYSISRLIFVHRSLLSFFFLTIFIFCSSLCLFIVSFYPWPVALGTKCHSSGQKKKNEWTACYNSMTKNRDSQSYEKIPAPASSNEARCWGIWTPLARRNVSLHYASWRDITTRLLSPIWTWSVVGISIWPRAWADHVLYKCIYMAICGTDSPTLAHTHSHLALWTL